MSRNEQTLMLDYFVPERERQAKTHGGSGWEQITGIVGQTDGSRDPSVY
jgi:hypothetical protein